MKMLTLSTALQPGLCFKAAARPAANRKLLCQQTRTMVSWIPRASQTETQPPQNDEDDELEIEKQMAKRKKRKGPKVVAPLVEATKTGQPLTKEQQFESSVVLFLFALFTLILLLGLFLAGSGFLSESVDDFAQTVVYPAYSPLVIFFLLCSSAYGYWKVLRQRTCASAHM